MAQTDGSAGANSASGAGGTGSLDLPLATLPQVHPCHDCGMCCRYIATEIDNPTTFKEFENLRWYLVHRDISVYIDHESDWFIEFKTSCEHLTAENTCGIYEQRPQICEEFSWDECEITTREDAWKYKFDHFDEFLAWLEKKRPKTYAKYRKKRQAMERRRRRAAEPESPAPEPSPLAGAGA